MNKIENREKIKQNLSELINSPTCSPFLFRTRFERTMLRVIKYAKNIDNEQLLASSSLCLKKMKGICDKSNMTPDGCLRSHTLLLGDMKEIYNII